MTDQTTDYGYDEVVETTSPEDALAQLAVLATSLRKAESLVAEREAALKSAKRDVDRINMVAIPDLMAACKIETFTTSNGFMIKVARKIRANIKEANKVEAFSWLIDNGHGGLIKTKLEAAFAREEAKKAEELELRLVAEGYAVQSKSSVNAASLSSFVKSELEGGRKVPMDLLSVFEQVVAKVTTK